MADLDEGNEHGNVNRGDVMIENARSNYIRAEHRMVAAIRVENLVIVETADAVLVAAHNKAQDVKKIVERLNASSRSESVTHRRVVRPWGA